MSNSISLKSKAIRFLNKNVKLRVLEKRRKKHECYLKKKKSELNKLSRNAQLQKQANIINNELSSGLSEMTFDFSMHFERNDEYEQDDEEDNYEKIGEEDDYEENDYEENESGVGNEENLEYADLFDNGEGQEENDQNFENEFNERTNSRTNYEFIYASSRLTLPEFNLFYRWLCQKMKLNKTNRNLLLSFIKTILPKDNIIPTSYYMLLKKLNKKTQVTKKCFKICSNCYCLYKNGCENETCQNPKSKKSIDALVFDFNYHLTSIIQRYWNEIQQYKSNLFKEFKNSNFKKYKQISNQRNFI